jgi:hypothetical protein
VKRLMVLLGLLLPTSALAAYDDVVLLGRHSSGWVCSGVATSAHEVLTAAHCLPIDSVAIGDGIGQPMQRFAVHSARRDPDTRRDLAVLTLSAPLPLKAFPGIDDGTRQVAGVVRVVGFGAVDPDGRLGFGRKHTRDLMVPGSLGCDREGAQRTGCRPGLEILIENTGASDACTGDSGGPVFVADSQSPTRWRLVAITSRAVGNARKSCGAGGIYTIVRSK